MSNYYRSLTEFGFELTGNKEKIDNIEHILSPIADFMQKSISKKANIEVSEFLSPDYYLSFHIISGNCQIGLYDIENHQIKQNADVDLLGDIKELSFISVDLYGQISSISIELNTSSQEHLIATNKAIIKAWGERDREKGIDTNFNHISQHSNQGYTSKDIPSFQRNLRFAYDIYQSNTSNSFDKQIAEAKQESKQNEVYTHFLMLSSRSQSRIAEIPVR